MNLTVVPIPKVYYILLILYLLDQKLQNLGIVSTVSSWLCLALSILLSVWCDARLFCFYVIVCVLTRLRTYATRTGTVDEKKCEESVPYGVSGSFYVSDSAAHRAERTAAVNSAIRARHTKKVVILYCFSHSKMIEFEPLTTYMQNARKWWLLVRF